MPEEPEQKQESVEELAHHVRLYAELVEKAGHELSGWVARLLREYADRFERAAKRDYEEAKAYFEKLHDGPSMICTAKNCALRNAEEKGSTK